MVVVAVTAAATPTASTRLASASPSCCSSSHQKITTSTRARATFQSSPASTTPRFRLGLPAEWQLGGACRISSPPSWSGLKRSPLTHRSLHPYKEKKGKFRGKVVHASLFGVGAPEALVIGVVALLVFGPKGLAEVARNLGKTLRAFQPTIRELQDVSREFKSTLEREIGLDEIVPSTNNTYKPTALSKENQQATADPRQKNQASEALFTALSKENQQATADPNGTPKPGAYTSEDLLKITEEQLAALASSTTDVQAQGSNPEEQDAGIVAEAPSKITAASNPLQSAAQMQSSEKTDEER